MTNGEPASHAPSGAVGGVPEAGLTPPGTAELRVCGFVPYPGNGAYGHWTCQRPRWHFGRHRFINYTIPRLPRLWRAVRPVRWWVRSKWRNYRLFRGSDYKTYPQRGDLASWVRSAVYAARYEPVDR